jgi:hypothetical protein
MITAAELADKLAQISSFLRFMNDLGIDGVELVKPVLENLFNTFVIRGKSVPLPDDYEINLARFDGKVEAVKVYKARTGLSLIESVEAIKTRMDQLGYKFKGY